MILMVEPSGMNFFDAWMSMISSLLVSERVKLAVPAAVVLGKTWPLDKEFWPMAVDDTILWKRQNICTF